MKRYGFNVIKMGRGVSIERSYWLARIPEGFRNIVDLGIEPEQTVPI